MVSSGRRWSDSVQIGEVSSFSSLRVWSPENTENPQLPFIYFYNVKAKGSGIQASISPVTDYWKNWPSVKILDFVKYV